MLKTYFRRNNKIPDNEEINLLPRFGGSTSARSLL